MTFNVGSIYCDLVKPDVNDKFLEEFLEIMSKPLDLDALNTSCIRFSEE